jgi:hypothetical protein
MVNIKQLLLMEDISILLLNYGVTWTQATSDTTRSWSSVAMSSDGKYQTAVEHDGGIYTSIDYGVTWTQATSDTQDIGLQ